VLTGAGVGEGTAVFVGAAVWVAVGSGIPVGAVCSALKEQIRITNKPSMEAIFAFNVFSFLYSAGKSPI
jgi:hypothetical protein